MLQDQSLVDVTLSCEGAGIKAHRLVLSANSAYFKNLFNSLQGACHYPVIVLKDVPLIDLKAIIEFIYKGEVVVEEKQLTSVLKSAEVLSVSGLTEVCQVLRQKLAVEERANGQKAQGSPSSGSEVEVTTRKRPRLEGNQASGRELRTQNDSSEKYEISQQLQPTYAQSQRRKTLPLPQQGSTPKTQPPHLTQLKVPRYQSPSLVSPSSISITVPAAKSTTISEANAQTAASVAPNLLVKTNRRSGSNSISVVTTQNSVSSSNEVEKPNVQKGTHISPESFYSTSNEDNANTITLNLSKRIPATITPIPPHVNTVAGNNSVLKDANNRKIGTARKSIDTSSASNVQTEMLLERQREMSAQQDAQVIKKSSRPEDDEAVINSKKANLDRILRAQQQHLSGGQSKPLTSRSRSPSSSSTNSRSSVVSQGAAANPTTPLPAVTVAAPPPPPNYRTNISSQRLLRSHIRPPPSKSPADSGSNSSRRGSTESRNSPPRTRRSSTDLPGPRFRHKIEKEESETTSIQPILLRETRKSRRQSNETNNNRVDSENKSETAIIPTTKIKHEEEEEEVEKPVLEVMTEETTNINNDDNIEPPVLQPEVINTNEDSGGEPAPFTEIKPVASDEPQIECPSCGKVFTNDKSWNEHVTSEHKT